MLVVNPASDDNSIANDVKYLLFLPNKGYLCNDNGWENCVNHGGTIGFNDFLPEGDTCHFDEPPVELISHMSANIVENVRIHRKMMTFTLEEMIEV